MGACWFKRLLQTNKTMLTNMMMYSYQIMTTGCPCNSSVLLNMSPVYVRKWSFEKMAKNKIF